MKLLSSDEESPQIKEGVDHLGVETRPFEARRAKISHLGEHGRRREHILVFNMERDPHPALDPLGADP